VAGTSVLRGEVYIANLLRSGGRLWKDRPVLVIQNDRGNFYSPETIVAAIRDAVGTRPLPVFVPVPRGTAGLAKDSVIDAAQILTVARQELSHRLGALPPDAMAAVDRAIRVSLGL
jgi:mRNA interferase MazF